jgi:hypothetical protein
MNPVTMTMVVVKAVPEGTWQNLHRIRNEDARTIEVGIVTKRRRCALSEVGKNQPGIFVRRVGSIFHLLTERPLFIGLLHALAVRVEAPAVVTAAQRVILDPAEGKLRASMWATEDGDMRRAGLAAIDRELLAKNLERLRFAGWQVLHPHDRMPKEAQVASRRCSGPNRFQICEIYWSKASHGPSRLI